MIHPFNNQTLTLWDRGDLKVQIRVVGKERPIAYCDGTEADELELKAIAEAEGTELPTIQRKILKTGREIWTIAGHPPEVDEDGW